MHDSLLDIKRRPVSEVVAGLKDEATGLSVAAGQKLLAGAAPFGVNLRDYLTLAVEGEDGLNGYETVLAALNLPIRQDLDQGIVLQAASDTFQKFPGTRALFPEVIDDILRWQSRQTNFETVAPMLANSRTIDGAELLSTVVNDDAAARQATFIVPEGSRIPVRSIRTSQTVVGMFKHGSSIRTTYEFSRRASLDLLVPFARRVARELELSKVAAATAVLINGDGVNAAAPEVDQSSFNATTGVTAVAGQIKWENFLYWLVTRAKAGTPVDTVVMNWDGWFQYNMLFAKPLTTVAATGAISTGNGTQSEALTKAGVQLVQSAVSLGLSVTPVLSSAVPANKIIGITKGETLEELVEAGSNIQESETSITNQTVTVTKTENTGYKLPWGDTRSVYDFGN